MQPVPDTRFLPGTQAPPATHARAAAHFLGLHLPRDAALQDEQEAAWQAPHCAFPDRLFRIPLAINRDMSCNLYSIFTTTQSRTVALTPDSLLNLPQWERRRCRCRIRKTSAWRCSWCPCPRSISPNEPAYKIWGKCLAEAKCMKNQVTAFPVSGQGVPFGCENTPHATLYFARPSQEC